MTSFLLILLQVSSQAQLLLPQAGSQTLKLVATALCADPTALIQRLF